MKNIEIEKLVRSNILKLKPYSSARDEYKGEYGIFLDANENPFNIPYNRYPDPLQLKVKEKISKIKHIGIENIFLGNGSDEAIDLSIRIFCNPGKDNIVAIEPTYGMYKVCSDINDVEYRPVLLKENFDLDTHTILNTTDKNTKLIFICSPNNPTGNSFSETDILYILENFNGILVLDEAYIDFSEKESLIKYTKDYNNLIILQTFSKAWGMAGIRLGMAFSNQLIISLFNKVKYPYNINILTLETASKALENTIQVKEWINKLINERNRIIKEIQKYHFVEKVYPSDANFILVKVKNADDLYNFLINKRVIVRNRSKIPLCNNCLRFTVGTEEENKILLKNLSEYNQLNY